MGVSLKSGAEIERMRLGAMRLFKVFEELGGYIASGRSTAEIAHQADRALRKAGGENAMLGYRGFPAGACLSVNDVATHGLPTRQILRAGDLVTVDLAVDLSGWKSDSGWTFAVVPAGAQARRLIDAAWSVTVAGVRAVRSGGRLGDVGGAIGEEAKRRGCAVIERFAGHGIGREIHEEPLVPHTGRRGTGETIREGIVLNIEPIVTFGSGEAIPGGDEWSFRTADSAPTAQYELTVAVTPSGVKVLTLGGITPEELPSVPPFY